METNNIENQENIVPRMIGKKLLDIKLKAYHLDRIKEIEFSDYQGKWLILFFYPGDFTFVCPTELAEMARLYPEFVKAGAEVLGISVDSVYVHKAWHDDSKAVGAVKFPLVADPTRKLIKSLGIYLEDEGEALRASYIIGPDGKIKSFEVSENNIGRNGNELLRKLICAKYVYQHKTEVCPASWQPGKKTLKPGLSLVGKI